MKFDKIFKKKVNQLTRSIILKEVIEVLIRLMFFSILLLFILSVIELSYDMSRIYRTWMMIGYSILVFIYIFVLITKKYRKNQFLFTNERTKLITLDGVFQDFNYLFIYDLLQIKRNNIDKDHSIIDSAINLNANKFVSLSNPSVFDQPYLLKYYLLPIIMVAIMIFSYNFKPMQNSILRLIYFNTEFSDPTSHVLSLQSKNISIIQGNELDIVCRITGGQPDETKVHKRPIISENYSSVNVSFGDSIALHKDKPSQSFYYYFSSEETNSDTGFVKVLKRPEIDNLKIKVDFPSYTNLKSEYYQDFIGSITVLKGSKLTFNITPSGKLDSLKLFQKNRSGLFSKQLDRTTEYFEYDTRVYSNSEFYFKLYYSVDSLLISNNDPIVYKVNTLNDNYPIVNLILPEDNYQLGETLDFPVFATAFDDFSIKKIFLNYRKIPAFSEFNPKNSSKFTSEKILYEQKSDGICVINTLKTIEGLDLLPDDKVEIFIRAYDNDNISGPKFSDSKHLFLIVPSLEQLFEETAKNYDTQDKAVEAEKIRNKQIRKDIEQLTQKLRKENIVEYQDQKELSKIAEEQSKMMDNIQNVEQQIQKNIDLLDKNTMLSTETMKKYKELQKMVGDLLTKDMKEKLEKLSELSNNSELDKNEMNELLNQFEDQQEEFQKGLDKTLEILKQIKQEYQLDKLIKLSEKMIEEQVSLNNQIPELQNNNKRLLKDEERIESSFNFLKEQLKELQKEMQESSIEKNLDELANEVNSKKIPDEFSSMKENLRSTEKELSAESGDKLRDEFLAIKNSLNSMKDKIIEEKKEEISKELDVIISELIFISEEIEGVKNFSNKLSYNSSHAVELIKRNSEIENSFNDITPKIFSVAKKTFFIDNQIMAKVGRILEQFDTIARILESRHFSVSTDRHKYIMGTVNQLVVLLDKAKEEMNNSKSASGLEEMLKKMEEMAAMQSGLNSDSQNAMRSENNSMSKMQEMMNKLAQQQAQLSEALSQMQSNMGDPQGGQDGKPGSEGNPGSSGSPSIPGDQGMPGQGNSGKSGKGNSSDPNNNDNSMNSGLGKKLGNIGKSMNEVSNDLKNKKLDESVLKKQKQILDKLLDAIESIKREKYSRKRESKGSNKFAIDPGEMKINIKNSLRENLIRSLKDGYSNDYKIKIKKYFRELEY